ncbi:MAG: hypothetical protein KGJ87_03690 [Planctomycetota bacterium]|nr:hypothetical protein [Planctomycetota bacterium]
MADPKRQALPVRQRNTWEKDTRTQRHSVAALMHGKKRGILSNRNNIAQHGRNQNEPSHFPSLRKEGTSS